MVIHILCTIKLEKSGSDKKLLEGAQKGDVILLMQSAVVEVLAMGGSGKQACLKLASMALPVVGDGSAWWVQTVQLEQLGAFAREAHH